MPLVQIEVLEGRPAEKIKKLIANVTDTVVESLDVPKANVRVIVREIPKSHWGIAGVAVEDIQGR